MKTKVYSFKPKGKGYRIYVTKKDHSRRGMGSTPSRRSSSATLDFLSGAFARFIVYGIFGMKK